MQVMLVYSANDAAYTLACAVSGDEASFADLMNHKAASLHMDNTNFADASGMEEPNHYSCARDLAMMGRYAMLNYPFIAATVQRHTCTVPVNGQDITFTSTDELMSTYDPLIGIKTGAGDNTFTFLGAAVLNGQRAYACVLGCPTKQGRFTDTQLLFEWLYHSYYSYRPFTTTTTIGYRPFAFHSGWYVPVAPRTEGWGCLAPEPRNVTYLQCVLPCGALCNDDTFAGEITWYQDGRYAASAELTTGNHPIPRSSIDSRDRDFVPAFVYSGQCPPQALPTTD